MLLQFDDHCDKYQLIPDFKSACRNGYSIETSLIKLCNDLLWPMERQEVMMMVLLDLSAVFGTVDHDLLLGILENRFRITGSALQWHDTYLGPQ